MSTALLIDVAIWSSSILGGMLAIVIALKTFLVIGRPNEVLVFSGRKTRLSDGTVVGFRVVRGGRSLRIPLLEKVETMDMTVMSIDIEIRGAYAKGNIPINVDAVANVKITNDDRLIVNAIERFLGRPREQLRSVAKETLEGTLRGVLALLTPLEVNHDRQKLADGLKREVADDLGQLGLSVDTFKIQHVTDEVAYLDSVGRVAIAEVVKEAEIAESDAEREADELIADAQMQARVAQERANATIIAKVNGLDRYKAELEARAASEEERTVAAGLHARAEAEHALQRVRATVETLRLEADIVIPAQTEDTAQQLRAAGDAAEHAERGHAQALALDALASAWEAAGEDASQIFLIEQVDRIIADIAAVADRIEIASVNLIDGGDGRTLARHVGSYPAVVAELLDRMEQTTGIDVVGLLTQDRSATGTNVASMSPTRLSPGGAR